MNAPSVPRPPIVARLACGLALSCLACTGLAQDAVWRCGQTLTNQLPSDEAMQRQCVPVSLSATTTVSGTRSHPNAPGQGKSPPATGRDSTSPVQINADEQRQRDARAKELLLAERQRVQAQLQQARRLGDATQVAHAEADLASIDRELARRP